MIDDLINSFVMKDCPTWALWEVLIEQGEFDLINKLRRIEMREPGFDVIVIPKEGFSQNDFVHNLVIDWLKEQNILLINIRAIKQLYKV
jgi:hypothetical protein